jgi:serine/threonine-protein kinase
MIGQTVRHYRIVDGLGRGGMGQVWLADDTRLERQVALKFLPHLTAKDETTQERFLREAKAAARLNHPNITQVYEFAEDEGELFIVMEYVRGRSLREIIREEPTRSVEDVLSWTHQVAEALVNAHGEGITHRDVKPANILITHDGVAKIVDFGLAKLKGISDLRTKQEAVGTAAYMPPEQIQNDDMDHRVDIWALGAVLFELLAGRPPFDGPDVYAVMHSILSDEPESILTERPDAPAELERIIRTALQKRAEKRYQLMRQMLDDLHSLLDGVRSGLIIPRAPPRRPPPSIAVLPFANLSADLDQEYFCEGIAEEIIGSLTKVEGLRVVARTSSFAFREKTTDVREIGRTLRVDTVLDGSVKKAGDQLRITAQLSDSDNGYGLWSDTFDRELEDVFAIQDEISLAIVDTLKVKLLGEESARLTKHHTEDLVAHSLYLKGRHEWGKRSEGAIRKAIGLFEQAIQTDPGYAPPLIGISDAFGSMGFWGMLPPKEAFPKAKAAALRALQIDESLGEAHGSLAWISTVHEWDWDAAEQRFHWALELNPNDARVHNWYAFHLTFRGRLDEAMVEIRKAIRLDPLSLLINANYGLIHYSHREYDQAIRHYRKTLELDPNFGPAHLFLGCAHVQLGELRDAVRELEAAVQLTGGIPWAVGYLGFAYARSGSESKARKLLRELEGLAKHVYVSPVASALIYYGLGNMDKLREWSEKAYEHRDVSLPHMKAFPEFDPLRSEPWYQELLRKMRLDE